MVAQKESLVLVQEGDMMVPMTGAEAERWNEHLRESDVKNEEHPTEAKN